MAESPQRTTVVQQTPTNVFYRAHRKITHTFYITKNTVDMISLLLRRHTFLNTLYFVQSSLWDIIITCVVELPFMNNKAFSGQVLLKCPLLCSSVTYKARCKTLRFVNLVFIAIFCIPKYLKQGTACSYLSIKILYTEHIKNSNIVPFL